LPSLFSSLNPPSLLPISALGWLQKWSRTANKKGELGETVAWVILKLQEDFKDKEDIVGELENT
jgi:phosphoribulokinase